MKKLGAGIRAVAVLGLVLSGSAAGALADVSEVVLAIHASSSRSEGVLEITSQDGVWDGGNFFWSTDHEIPIMSGTEVLGTIGAGSRIALYADPQIAMGFSFQADDADVNVTVTAATLSFPEITNGLARADAAFTLMDFLGSGATLTGLEPAGGAYRASYNLGTTFAEGIGPMAVVPPAPLSDESFGSPGGGAYTSIGPVSSMDAEIAFTLSAHAFASGSSNFEIIPEPAGLLLLVVGLGVLRRR
jgi:hypothetical protein